VTKHASHQRPSSPMLHAPARSGDEAAVNAALEADPSSVNLTDKLSRTALHLAAWAGHARVCLRLLDAKADPHAKAMDGITALAFAAQNGHVDATKTLLLGGARVNVKDSKKQNTPLHLAAAKGHSQCVAYLLTKNADVRMKNKSGKTAVEVCMDARVRQLLLDHKPKGRPAPDDAQDSEEGAGDLSGAISSAAAKHSRADDVGAAALLGSGMSTGQKDVNDVALMSRATEAQEASTEANDAASVDMRGSALQPTAEEADEPSAATTQTGQSAAATGVAKRAGEVSARVSKKAKAGLDPVVGLSHLDDDAEM